MRADKIGLYIHIPFCKRKCSYCDFCSFPIEDKAEYIKALCREIDAYKENNIAVDTIFFGGGTPSLLSSEEFRIISEHIRYSFDLSSLREFTLEANPKTLTLDKLFEYTRDGVNRISLGLQSIHENELEILGRIHSYDEFLSTYKMVKNFGLKNINVDLMYGIPEQTKKSFEESLKTVLELDPDHLSLYGLILEEGTPLYDNRELLKFPSEDEECDMYFSAQEIISEYGFSHYEVSNYCKSGMECIHNLKYWRAEEYIGVGLSAYSYFDKKRFGNTSSLSDYIAAKNVIGYSENINPTSEAYEYVLLRTRLKEGFSFEDYKKRFGTDFLLGREKLIASLSDKGYINVSDGRLSFTDKGMYVGNSLLTDLI